MKIIRHSHKMSVYSLSLLLYAQQISCMQQPVLTIDTSGQAAIMAKLKALNSTNARIDMMQTMLGSVIKNTELNDTNAAKAVFENVPLDDITINNRNAEQTQQKLIDMQQQVLRYKAQYLPSMKGWRATHNNEIAANTLSAAVAGFVLNRQQYQPNLNVITGGRHNLPENPRDLDANDTITALKLALGNIPDNVLFLEKTVQTYKKDLDADHTFFLELEASCCCATPAQKEDALARKIKWRALAIPLTCFAQKQQVLLRLKINTASQSTTTASSTTATAQPQPQQHAGQQLYGTMKPQGPPPNYTDKPHPLNQVADPFIPGSGVGNIQYKPQPDDGDDSKK